MKARIIQGNNWLEDGTAVPYCVRYFHPTMGECNEFFTTLEYASIRAEELEDLLPENTKEQ